MSASKCYSCAKIHPAEANAWPDSGEDFVYALYRLKRIPPLDELEGEQRKEELHA